MRIVVIGLIAGLLTGCSHPEKYPEQVRLNFVKGCAARVKGNTGLCDCLFEKIEKQYNFTEYVRLEEKMKEGNTPREFLQFIDSATLECMKRRQN